MPASVRCPGTKEAEEAVYLPVDECRALLGQHGAEEECCSPVKQAYKENFFVYLLLCASSCPLASTLVIFNTTLPSQNASLLVFPLLSYRDIWYSSYLKMRRMAGERNYFAVMKD